MLFYNMIFSIEPFNFETIISTALKVQLIEHLVQSVIKNIEANFFVSPKLIQINLRWKIVVLVDDATRFQTRSNDSPRLERG